MQHNTLQPFDKHLSHHAGSCVRPAVDDSGKQLQQEETTDDLVILQVRGRGFTKRQVEDWKQGNV